MKKGKKENLITEINLLTWMTTICIHTVLQSLTKMSSWTENENAIRLKLNTQWLISSDLVFYTKLSQSVNIACE